MIYFMHKINLEKLVKAVGLEGFFGIPSLIIFNNQGNYIEKNKPTTLTV